MQKTKTRADKASVIGIYNIGQLDGNNVTVIPEKQEQVVRFVCMSDTHTEHNIHKIPYGDIWIHCGDYSNSATEEEILDFAAYVKDLPHKYKLVITGNHDYPATFSGLIKSTLVF